MTMGLANAKGAVGWVFWKAGVLLALKKKSFSKLRLARELVTLRKASYK